MLLALLAIAHRADAWRPAKLRLASGAADVL